MYSRSTLRALTRGNPAPVPLAEGLEARTTDDGLDVYCCGGLLGRYTDDVLVLFTSNGYPALIADSLNQILPEHGLVASVGLNEVDGTDTVMLADPDDPSSEPWSIDNGQCTLHYNAPPIPLPVPYRHLGPLVTVEQLLAHLLDAHGCRGPGHYGELVLAGFHADTHTARYPQAHAHTHPGDADLW